MVDWKAGMHRSTTHRGIWWHIVTVLTLEVVVPPNLHILWNIFESNLTTSEHRDTPSSKPYIVVQSHKSKIIYSFLLSWIATTEMHGKLALLLRSTVK